MSFRRYLVQLGTDAANKNILKGWHLTEENGRTVFDLAVGLRQWGEDDISFFHT